MYRSRRKNRSRDEISRKLDASPTRSGRRTRQSYEPSPIRNSRSTTYEPSPSRSSTRSRAYEPSPLRSSRAKTYEPSPSRTIGSARSYGFSASRDNLAVNDKEMMSRKFQVSPLRISFRSRRVKESPSKENERESRRYGRIGNSPSRNDFTRSSFRRNLAFDESPVRDTARTSVRSRNLEVPARDNMRFREQEPSPVRDRRSENVNFRRAPPSPTATRNRRSIYEFDPLFDDEDFYENRKGRDQAPPSPQLGVRAVNSRRAPLRELPTSLKPSQSYRVSCSSRDDDSDLYYLTKVREILLGNPIKGNTQHPAQILPHMYIGNQANAESYRLLRKLGVTHVLNCAGYKGPRKNPDANPYEGLNIDYLEFKADDRDGYDMSQHFDDAFRYLDNVKRSSGICLVHCALGINRSGVTVTSYLMIHNKWPLLKAVEFVKRKRGVVLSNHGFQRLLIRFARQQSLLEALPDKYHSMRSGSPEEERLFVRSMQQAKHGHWGDALGELKRKPREREEFGVPLQTELGSDPGSALLYRYARFMNRDKV